MSVTNGVNTLLQIIQTLLLGGIGLFIAWKEYKANQQQLLIVLYERRIKIYNNFMELIDFCARGANSNQINISEENREAYQTLKAKFDELDKNGYTYEAEFLFSYDFLDTMNEVWNRINELIVALDNYEYKKAKKELKAEDKRKIVDLFEWFKDQREIFKKEFSDEIFREFRFDKTIKRKNNTFV